MQNITKKLTMLSIALLLLLSACGPSKAEIMATETQIAVDQSSTQTAQAKNDAATLTAAAPTITPTATYTPEPTSTPTPLPLGQLSGKVFWYEGGGPVATSLSLKAVEGGETQKYSVRTDGKFSFTDIEPGTYIYEFQIALDNPVFEPCSNMGFKSGEGITYTASIINGEIKLIIGRSEPFPIAAGDQLEKDIPFSFDCK